MTPEEYENASPEERLSELSDVIRYLQRKQANLLFNIIRKPQELKPDRAEDVVFLQQCGIRADEDIFVRENVK